MKKDSSKLDWGLFSLIITLGVFLILFVINLSINRLNEFYTVYVYVIFVILAFIVLSIAYLISHSYTKIKSTVYQKPLKFIRFVIVRQKSKKIDLVLFFAVSSIFNFCLILFVNTTDILPTISSQPYLQLLNILKTNEPIEELSVSPEDTLVMVFISYSGPMLLLFLRQMHYKLTRIENNPRYPGSRFLIGFLYTTAAITAINYIVPHITNFTTIELPEIIIDTTTIEIVAILGSISIVIAWLLDQIYSKLRL